ncbi:MAG TPA: sulfotransferase [Solirubrobacteraceae bacterium]|nr:sulfotransferase [Solirubrobacteraceae bacterium]
MGHATYVSGRRVPDFFIVGHAKCGTTALHHMLKDHPQIFMSEVKEPRFFNTDLRSRFEVGAARPRPQHTLEGYLSLFAAAREDQRVGEASPQYIRSHDAPSGIAQVQPDARVIAILREPASFLRSFHLQMVSSNVESERDFRKAIELEPARREGKRIPRRSHHPDALLYSEHVRYAEQLRRFHAAFPRENVLVLIYDDYRSDNEGTLRRVLRFLDVDDTAAIATLDTKPLKAIRSPRLHHLANAARLARTNPDAASPLGRTVDALTSKLRGSDAFKTRWRSLAYRTPNQPDEKLMLELRRRHKGEVVALSEYLDRDLVGLWGYDKLG